LDRYIIEEEEEADKYTTHAEVQGKDREEERDKRTHFTRHEVGSNWCTCYVIFNG
jgi:hypothetical protein